jgi:hypothetical protein
VSAYLLTCCLRDDNNGFIILILIPTQERLVRMHDKQPSNEAAEARIQQDEGDEMAMQLQPNLLATLPVELRLMIWEMYYADRLVALLLDKHWQWRWNAQNHVGALSFSGDGTGEVGESRLVRARARARARASTSKR